MTDVSGQSIAWMLQRAKRAFVGGSDAGMLAHRLENVLPRGHLQWLEVGVGDGNNLQFLLQALSTNRTFDVVGVDPEAVPARLYRHVQRCSIYHCGIEDYEVASHEWDCINARQSLYYFQDPIDSLSRLSKNLSKGGVLAVTVWTRNCCLYKFHRYLADIYQLKISHDICAEALVSTDDHFYRVLSADSIELALDVDEIYAQQGVANALLGLATRKLLLPDEARCRGQSLIRRFFEDTQADPVRSNAILLFGPVTEPS